LTHAKSGPHVWPVQREQVSRIAPSGDPEAPLTSCDEA
jgi:hypothetical protein